MIHDANSYLTPEGHKKLIHQLEHLKKVRRRQISKEIEKARGHGDISENAEYDAAKDAQAHNEQKIAEMEFNLAHAQIIDNENISKDEILIGASVKILDVDTGEELEYILVSEMEADYSQGKISITSPVGKGLMNHKVDEIVEIKIADCKIYS